MRMSALNLPTFICGKTWQRSAEERGCVQDWDLVDGELQSHALCCGIVYNVEYWSPNAEESEEELISNPTYNPTPYHHHQPIYPIPKSPNSPLKNPYPPTLYTTSPRTLPPTPTPTPTPPPPTNKTSTIQSQPHRESILPPLPHQYNHHSSYIHPYIHPDSENDLCSLIFNKAGV